MIQDLCDGIEDIGEDVITPPRIKCVIEPDPRIQSEYEAAYASFAKAFDAIKEFS